jgi:opacity protein-like surface antigen
MFNLSGTGSEQDVETTDNFESLGLTFGFDTSIGNHGLSPYLMLNTINYETDATNTSFMGGFGNYYAINDTCLLNYGYSYSDSKNNQTSSYSTADETNVISQSITAGYDFTLNETISTSLGLGYGNSDAKADTNDYENFDLDLRLNLALPFAYTHLNLPDYQMRYKQKVGPNLIVNPNQNFHNR